MLFFNVGLFPYCVGVIFADSAVNQVNGRTKDRLRVIDYGFSKHSSHLTYMSMNFIGHISCSFTGFVNFVLIVKVSSRPATRKFSPSNFQGQEILLTIGVCTTVF